ncbi:MAG: hypothetical protein COX40_02075, partial [Candidatus Omnitrophica bacterium CG23_combo_of_CG06-09_8_20_14_all_40_11]
VWLPSPGLIGEAGARLCAVAKATGQKAVVWLHLTKAISKASSERERLMVKNLWFTNLRRG